jgi:hypothetical protein
VRIILVASARTFSDARFNSVVAVIAFVILFATFATALRCFADFDKGLLSAKTAGKSTTRSNYAYTLTLLAVVQPSQAAFTSGKNEVPTNLNEVERQSFFQNGAPLQPRMSIE